MSDHDPLADLLGTAGEDAGCEGGFTVLAEYVEAELDGRNVVQLFPGGRGAPPQLPCLRRGLPRLAGARA